MRKLRGRGRLVAAVFALAVVPLAVTGIAMALTPSLGVLTDANTTTTVKFDDGPFKVKTREPVRVRTAHVGLATVATPWHTHPGPEIIAVKEGSLNIFVARTRRGDDDDDDDDGGGSSQADCETIVLTAGQAYIGSPNVPFRLTASGPVEFTVTHLLEIGEPFQTNVPDPTC